MLGEHDGPKRLYGSEYQQGVVPDLGTFGDVSSFTAQTRDTRFTALPPPQAAKRTLCCLYRPRAWLVQHTYSINVSSPSGPQDRWLKPNSNRPGGSFRGRSSAGRAANMLLSPANMQLSPAACMSSRLMGHRSMRLGRFVENTQTCPLETRRSERRRKTTRTSGLNDWSPIHFL
ncbi:uncharacterized protein BDZ99DRAFT_163131 [Mytilinidion resinicola]|uniref:Uncharacterized protein n=1 Tax=Mytilinidion resinicola TaxID=574789 RepID=A0A6A6Y5A1_9PEZI|nr:uncharacterized protein BDZ99DRAFT_163131 [Mytilinidion resinicola]KAF2803799.1 hypothetical protein BDZ99DRAFT_163131 [Mytilinidion resinicola]